MKRILTVLAVVALSGCAETQLRMRSNREQTSLRYVMKLVQEQRKLEKTEWEYINDKLTKIEESLKPKPTETPE